MTGLPPSLLPTRARPVPTPISWTCLYSPREGIFGMQAKLAVAACVDMERKGRVAKGGV